MHTGARTGVQYRKMHYGWTDKSNNGGDEPSHSNFLARGLTAVSPTAPEYALRPAAFQCASFGSKKGSFQKGDCEQVNDLTLYNYPTADHASDKRVAYSNPSYPWIEAVHKFKAIKPTDDKNGFPKQFDTARFSVPASGGPGQYIIQYYWRGCLLPRVDPVAPVAHLARSLILAHGILTHGIPAHGMLAHGMLTHGIPAHGIPAHGMLAHGIPAHGIPAHGMPAHGIPAHGIPAGEWGLPHAP